MDPRIPPQQENDLPVRQKSFWRMTGPGAVMVGLAVGSGEMVLWPWITAKFGAGMAWAAVLGIFVQVWVNFEIGRWAVATGESAFTGFARVSSKFIYVFMAILFSLASLPSWARATAIIIRYLFFGLEEEKTGQTGSGHCSYMAACSRCCSAPSESTRPSSELSLPWLSSSC